MFYMICFANSVYYFDPFIIKTGGGVFFILSFQVQEALSLWELLPKGQRQNPVQQLFYQAAEREREEGRYKTPQRRWGWGGGGGGGGLPARKGRKVRIDFWATKPAASGIQHKQDGLHPSIFQMNTTHFFFWQLLTIPVDIIHIWNVAVWII